MMNEQQIKNLERNAIFTLRIHDGLKESVMNDYLEDLSKKVKKEVKRSELAVVIVKVN
jgi:hypothetical protein